MPFFSFFLIWVLLIWIDPMSVICVPIPSLQLEVAIVSIWDFRFLVIRYFGRYDS